MVADEPARVLVSSTRGLSSLRADVIAHVVIVIVAASLSFAVNMVSSSSLGVFHPLLLRILAVLSQPCFAHVARRTDYYALPDAHSIDRQTTCARVY